MLLLLEIVVIVLVWGVWWYRNDKRKYSKYPPGPARLPLIGNIHQVMAAADFPATAFMKLRDIYGEIMFLKLGMTDSVVFSSKDVIHEMLLHDKTADRHQFEFVKDRHNNKNLGVIWGNGKPWQTLRRFTMRNLREFGFGKTSTMDVVVHDEIEKFTENLKKQVDIAPNKTILVKDLFSLTIVNVLWRIVSDKSYSYDDTRMLRLLQLNSDFFRSVNMGCDPSESFPFLRKWFPNWSGKNVQLKAMQALYDYGKELLDEQRKETSDEKKSFIDLFSSKVDETTDDPETDFTDEQFVVTILDLLIGGAETSSNTLTFGILYMLLNPHIQEKVQEEIDRVVPKDVQIDSAMKSKLPYTAATILEIYRYSTVIPTPAARAATEDFFFRDYFIRKGTSLIFNLYAVHYDEKAWGDPLSFRPERFLNSDGTAIDQDVATKLEIFGAGRRFCMGQSLAEMATFLYFSRILRQFKFVKVPGTNPTTEPILGITSVPHPFKVQILERK